MCRLYLYTTLKINEILAVVYHTQNVENSPGYVTPMTQTWMKD